MAYNLAQPYNRSFKGPIDSSLVFASTTARTNWLATPEGLAIAYSGMIVSDLETNKAYILNSSSQWQELASSQLATSSISGLVQLFSDTVQDQAAQSVSNNSNRTYGIQFNSSNQLVVNVPWTDTNTVYTHPTQTSISESSADGKVLSAISVNTLGHVTSVGTKTLAENDIPLLSQSKISNLTTDLSSKLDKSGGTMTGYLTLSGDPTNTDHAATKGYVDALKQGLYVKDSVRVLMSESNASVTPVGAGPSQLIGSTINSNLADGVTLVLNDRLLMAFTSSQLQKYNGIYYVKTLATSSTGYVLERSLDANEIDKNIKPGLFAFVTEGTSADTGWVLTTDWITGSGPTLNVGALNFSQFSSAGQVNDGLGLTKVNNIISVGAGDGISVLIDSVAVNETVVRTSGTQTITGEKDFENNLKTKPIYNPANVGWFPAFNVEPSTTSQKMVYMTKADLVTALSFETPELGNSFVNTTGNQSISGFKTFDQPTEFKGNPQAGGGTIKLNSSNYNVLAFNASGTSSPPTNTNIASGTKILLAPISQAAPPYSIGIGSSTFWHTVPNIASSYEWYAGATKIATLYGDGTFNATNISGANFYLNGTRITSSATELNLLSFANINDILIGNGSSFFKQNFITALSGAIISQSGLTVTNNTSKLIINHNTSTATSTTNSNPNVVQNILIDEYGHITGINNLDLDTLYLTSSDLNTQIQFVGALGSSYADNVLTVSHNAGSKTEGTYGTDGVKSITIDSYGHISDVQTGSYLTATTVCDAITNCPIDGGTY